MERSGVGIVSQIGFESTPGTPVAANKLLKSISFKPTLKQANQKFRPQGFRVPATLARHKNWAEGSFDGVLDYNGLPYILECLFNAATPSTVATGAYQRIYVPGVETADSTRKTVTIERGDATAADQYGFGQLTSLQMEAGQEDMNVKGNLVAQYPTQNTTLTASPTKIADRLVQRGDINVYLDDTYGARGTTQLLKVSREMLDIPDKYQPAFFHNRAKSSFTDVVEKDYEPKFDFTMSHDAVSRTLLASILANPEKFLVWEARGNLITGSTYELIKIEMAVKFDEPEEIDDQDGVYAYKFNCALMPNTSLGSYMTITVINTIATL